MSSRRETRTPRWLACAVLALALPTCADSHPPPVSCTSDAECPAGICVGEGDGRGVCLLECDHLVATRCEDGAWCRVLSSGDYCWFGGTVGEGDIASAPGDCAFGLGTIQDYTAEPLRWVCEPVCNDSAHCRGGELCLGRCMPPCTPSTCVAPNRCALGTCVNERRFAQIDCDADGTPDCYPGLVCDPEAIGGCGYPAAGEE